MSQTWRFEAPVSLPVSVIVTPGSFLELIDKPEVTSPDVEELRAALRSLTLRGCPSWGRLRITVEALKEPAPVEVKP